MVYIGQRDGVGNRDSALFLSPHDNSWWSFVQSDAEAFELRFDDPLVTEGLEDVEHDEDKVARTRDCEMVGNELSLGAGGRSYRQ